MVTASQTASGGFSPYAESVTLQIDAAALLVLTHRSVGISKAPNRLPADLKTPQCELAGELDSLFAGSHRATLETALPQFLLKSRWFAGKARSLLGVRLLDVLDLQPPARCRILLVEVEYPQGDAEVYAVPVYFASRPLHPEAQATAILTIKGSHDVILCEATGDEEFWDCLFRSIGTRSAWAGMLGDGAKAEVKLLGCEQSNTSVTVASRAVIKLFRQLWAGENPELEVGRFLTQRGFGGAPSLQGEMEYRRQDGRIYTLAVMHEFIPNHGSGWSYTLEQIGRHLDLFPEGQEDYLDSIELLGERTGELHLALVASSDPGFAPEAFTAAYQHDVSQAMRADACEAFALLRASVATLDSSTAAGAERVLQSKALLLDRYRVLSAHVIRTKRIRCHGDFHLGQVLFTGKDFRIIDFEGETGRPIPERRLKSSPIRDVAGMIRSFHYASRAALRLPGPVPFERRIGILSSWCLATSERFLHGYLKIARRGDFLPESEEDFRHLLTAYTLDKAIYELRYELNNRPDWVSIPIDGLLSILDENR